MCFSDLYRLSEKLSLGVNNIIQEYDGHDQKCGLGLHIKTNSEYGGYEAT